MTIDVVTQGDGPAVWLVHGAIADPESTWERQAPLAERWSLRVVRRPGFGVAPPPAGSDWVAEGSGLAELLDEPGHLVGHSYGAMVAFEAAGRRPESVSSLTLVEPPAYSLLRGDPEIERAIADVEHARRDAAGDFGQALRTFAGLMGMAAEVQDPLPAPLARRVRLFLGERLPWEAELPVAAVARAPFPKLVVAGDWSTAQVRAADVVAHAVGAERVTVPGGHNVHRRAGEFNPILERFLKTAEASVPAGRSM